MSDTTCSSIKHERKGLKLIGRKVINGIKAYYCPRPQSFSAPFEWGLETIRRPTSFPTSFPKFDQLPSEIKHNIIGIAINNFKGPLRQVRDMDGRITYIGKFGSKEQTRTIFNLLHVDRYIRNITISIIEPHWTMIPGWQPMHSFLWTQSEEPSKLPQFRLIRGFFWTSKVEPKNLQPSWVGPQAGPILTYCLSSLIPTFTDAYHNKTNGVGRIPNAENIVSQRPLKDLTKELRERTHLLLDGNKRWILSSGCIRADKIETLVITVPRVSSGRQSRLFKTALLRWYDAVETCCSTNITRPKQLVIQEVDKRYPLPRTPSSFSFNSE